MKVDGTAAVTGAGQGIGSAVARALVHRGFDVLALVLEESQREAVEQIAAGAPGSVTTQILDVTDPGDFRFPSDLHVVVNNAGICLSYLPIEEAPPDAWRRTFDVNFFGLVEVTRRAIPVLRAAGRGVICNISSAALFSSIPFLGPYRASKAAVSAFCESLRIELVPFGIRVVEVMPSATISGINANSIVRRIADAAEYPAYRRMAEIQFELNQQAPEASPAEVAAEAIVDAICDDDGPMRYGTDERSRTTLERWRTTPDEVLVAETLAKYGEILSR